jgi:predicted PurR-regulated permease PerM
VAPQERTVVVRLSIWSGALVVAMAVAGIAAVRIFLDAHRPLSWAAAAVVGAVVLDPIVDVLARRIRRVPAVLLCFVVVGGAALGIAYLAFDDIDRAIDRLQEAAPDAAARIEARDDRIGQVGRDLDLAGRVDDAVDALEDRFGSGGGEQVIRSTALTAPAYLVGAILTVFLMSYGPRLGRAALDQLPAARRDHVAVVFSRASRRARDAGLLTLADAATIGTAAGLAAWLLDLPAPAALGVVAGSMAVLTHLGIILGALPVLLLTLGLRSGTAAVVLAVATIALQAADSFLVRPRIDHHVRIGLLVPVVVLVLAHAVYGVGAAVFGFAYAIFGLAVLDELLEEAGSAGDPAAADG